ncbi:MAG: NUDIX domain-containing protein [Acutalibacteraceae bacterium]
MEIWDAYNANSKYVGVDLIRGQAIPDGMFHIVSEVLVVHKDGSYLLMKRDFNKPNFGGFYEATAGGSALKGETPYNAAVRELKEETGIIANKLCQIYKYTDEKAHTIYYGFLCETDCDKNSVVLQKGETIGFCWLNKTEFLKYTESDRCIKKQISRLTPYLNSIML